jgi:hypothetical protein
MLKEHDMKFKVTNPKGSKVDIKGYMPPRSFDTVELVEGESTMVVEIIARDMKSKYEFLQVVELSAAQEKKMKEEGLRVIENVQKPFELRKEKRNPLEDDEEDVITGEKEKEDVANKELKVDDIDEGADDGITIVQPEKTKKK